MWQPLVFIAVLSLIGCSPYPQDTHGTLNEVEQQGRLRVGVIEHQPWSFREEDRPKGIEVELIAKFAETLNVEPEWVYLAESQAIEQLKRYQLDVVIGGIVQKNPRGKEVSFTRPYLTTGETAVAHHVMAVPPGENQVLVTLEVFLKTHEALAQQAYQAEVSQP